MPPKLAPYPLLGGDCNDRLGCKPAHNARQCPIHPCNDNNHARLEQYFTIIQKPVDAGNTHIIKGVDPAAQGVSIAWASSATGTSDVPPLTIRTRPFVVAFLL